MYFELYLHFWDFNHLYPYKYLHSFFKKCLDLNIPNGLMMFYETVRYSPYDTQSDHPRWAVPCITTRFALSPCTLVYTCTVWPVQKLELLNTSFKLTRPRRCALKQWVISIIYIRPCIILNIWIQIIDVQASSFFYSSMGFSKVDTRSAGQQQQTQNPRSPGRGQLHLSAVGVE